MNEDKIIQHMISFVEEKEKEAQANKLLTNQQAKADVVKSILDELEAKTADEN